MSCLVSFCSRPAIIIDPPDGSSTVLEARRTSRLGTTTLGEPEPEFRENEPTLLSSETSVDSFSEMRPPDSTTGVKPRPTPNCLNSMVTRPLLSCPVGTGNSPPTRNLAGSPETVVRFGSARVRTSPARSKAWISALPWFRPLDPETVPPRVVSFWKPLVRPPSKAPLTP